MGTGDSRQELVQALRDSKLVRAVHVDTTENLSDLFTKALDLGTFIRFRRQLMHFQAIPVWAGSGSMDQFWVVCR
jgi:hypothetical protein